MNEQLLGAHNSIAGGVDKAIDLANKLGFTAMQIYILVKQIYIIQQYYIINIQCIGDEHLITVTYT